MGHKDIKDYMRYFVSLSEYPLILSSPKVQCLSASAAFSIGCITFKFVTWMIVLSPSLNLDVTLRCADPKGEVIKDEQGNKVQDIKLLGESDLWSHLLVDHVKMLPKCMSCFKV